MLKKVISIAIILVMLIMLTACDSKLLSRIDELEATIREQSDRIEQLEKENEQLSGRVEQMEKEIEKLEEESEYIKGAFYTLEESFDNGWLTRNDIMHISYFRYGIVMEGTVGDRENWKIIDFEPQIDTPQLSSKLEIDVKNTFYKLNRDLCQDRDGNEVYSTDDVTVKFYGRYNDSYVVVVDCSFILFGATEIPKSVDGIVWGETPPVMQVFRYFNIK